MIIAVILLVILIIVLLSYMTLLQLQLRSMNRQLTKRLTEHSSQPIHLELINSELTALAANINNSLKAEENLRLHGIREEKRFKQLIANISHDLRTPLTAIKGYQQLLDNEELSEEQRKKLRTAGKHADALGRLIEQFFEYSYLHHADSTIQRERINLTNLVTDCLAASVTALEERGLPVHLAESPPVFVHADKEKVLRIVHNLIRNAIQHSSGDIEVQLQAVDIVTLSFRNPVKQAAALDVSRLFDRFYTGDQARSGSTGLGLSIVRLLAEQMGGSASAALQEGILEIRVELPSADRVEKA